jgi:hypothetical protein
MFSKLHARRLVLLAVVSIFAAGVFAGPASAAGPLPGTFTGAAWGNRANAAAGPIATKLGRAAYLPCPCLGTAGKVISATQSDVDTGDGNYSADKLVSTAQAQKTTDHAYGRMTSRITNLSALGGRITAQSLLASANVDATAGATSVNGSGSSITGLRINGEPRVVSRGERINLPGIGYVIFHAVQKYGDGTPVRGVRVDMMRIVVTRANSLDLPVGAVISAGHAEMGFVRAPSGATLNASAWGAESSSASSDIENAIGRVAPTYLGCLSKGTRSSSNEVNATSAGTMLRTGTVVSTTYGTVSDTSSLARGTSSLKSVNLLNGLLTADTIKGVATAALGTSGGQFSFAGSKFVNLRVLGKAIGDNVAPNTNISIPGLGTLTLYKTQGERGATGAQATVTMAVLNVTVVNPRGIPVGTQYRLAHAAAIARI